MTDFEAIVASAVRAPSVHNSQPWQFRLIPDGIELRADWTRHLTVADRDGRELLLSCGAALYNLRLAILHAGVEPIVSVVAEGGVVARVRFGGAMQATPEESALFGAIGRRRTNRKPFLDEEVDPAAVRAMADAATAERGALEIISDRAQLASLHGILVDAHAAQLDDPEWVAEFTSWVGGAKERADGVALSSSGPQPEPQDQWALRDFGLGRAASRAEGKDFEPDPLIAVVASYADDPAAQVQAGQVLQRVLLTATARGLAASFLSQLVEVDAARVAVRDLLGSRVYPQMVLRIGHGNPVPPSARRPLAEVFHP